MAVISLGSIASGSSKVIMKVSVGVRVGAAGGEKKLKISVKTAATLPEISASGVYTFISIWSSKRNDRDGNIILSGVLVKYVMTPWLWSRCKL